MTTHLSTAFGAAVRHVAEIRPVAWVLGGLWSVLSFLLADAWTFAFVLASAASVWDVRSGVRVARYQDAVAALLDPPAPAVYSPQRKRAGWDAKVTLLILLVGMRASEYWAAQWRLFDAAGFLRWLGLDGLAAHPAVATAGFVSALVTFAVAMDEAASIDRHRQALGGSPMPVLSAILQLGGAAQERAAEVLRTRLGGPPPAG